ncbi:alkaline phosphatase [Candidatus Tenderia electrophaga]|jgi:membrane protein YqaA with SNARE-associated domain|uniref:Alkaline phosphatase n=1 Tax=Candidatus Tenderia electrophaga TaxID=1748243 RepID=A0A0S2TBA4_9GAMM|nr:alkaline phosphatase [Candidatus Tenderia electrophaga]
MNIHIVSTTLRQRFERLVTSKHLVSGMAIASFAESTVVPVPLEVVLVPAMQANRQRLWWLSGAALVGCLLGAIVGYAIGYWFVSAIGEQIVNLFGNTQQYEKALAQIRNNGFWFVLSVGLIPIPFQIAMLAAGAAKYSLFGYLLATFISRGVRYFSLALLVWKYGDGAQALIERHKCASMATITGLVIGLWGLRWVLGN